MLPLSPLTLSPEAQGKNNKESWIAGHRLTDGLGIDSNNGKGLMMNIH